MPFSRLRKGAFCIILNPRLNEKPGTVHLYWQLMARRDLCVATTKSYVEILNFRHFAKHFVFSPEGKNSRDKHLKNYFDVSVVVDIGCGNTTN